MNKICKIGIGAAALAGVATVSSAVAERFRKKWFVHGFENEKREKICLMKVLSLFDGISCGRLALERAGLPVERYDAFEIDKSPIFWEG